MGDADRDWAIVAGISKYPVLGNLGGPEHDAKDFVRWLTRVAKLPKKQVTLIVSPNGKKKMSVIDAQPNTAVLDRAFDVLRSVAEKNEKKGKGLKVGRRLYIFLAGHGFAPKNDAALLMANATRDAVGYHIPGRPYADWFLYSGLFEQVVLLMDCCRESYPQAPLRVPPYVDLTDPQAVDQSRLLYGFATKWSRLAREKPIGAAKKLRGIFSYTVLQGLDGAAADDQGEITARSLSNYVYNNMQKLLTKAELEDPEIPKDPELVYDTNPEVRFVLAKGKSPKVMVSVSVKKGDVGKTVQAIRTVKGKLEIEKVKVMKSAVTLNLLPGVWLVQLLGTERQAPVEVGGGGAAHVAH